MSIISIIIPIYNVEKYIHRCVDSVISQTYQNLEIILVDDGSPDNCGKICDEYAMKDNRIKVIHKENGGLSDARNYGIDSATGEWLFFLDSDDWIHPQTIEKLYDAAMKNNVSVSLCTYFKSDSDWCGVDTTVEAEVWFPKDLYINKYIISTVAWAKLYRRECFKDIRYPVGKIHEDAFVTYRILFAQEKLAFIQQPYYSYFDNSESITGRLWNKDRAVILEALQEQLTFFNSLGDRELIEVCEKKNYFYLAKQFTEAKKANCKEVYKQLTRKAFFLTLKSPRKLFATDNIWVLEHFFPRFMRCYWLIKSILKKMSVKKIR